MATIGSFENTDSAEQGDRASSAARIRLAANAAAAFAAVLFGASVVAVRIAVRDVPPLSLAFLRFGQGALVLLVGLAIFRRDLLRVAWRDVPYLALLGVIFYAIFPVTFNAGMQYVDASRGGILLATMPLFTLVLARRATGERLLPRQVIGVLTSFAGVAVIMAEASSGRGASADPCAAICCCLRRPCAVRFTTCSRSASSDGTPVSP